jgi:ATP-GRASP peptide maturase of grasp-with-spasm system
MILLLSDNLFQSSMDEVIEWLHFYGAPFIRVNGLNPDELDELRIRPGSRNSIRIDGQRIRPEEIGAVWFFRWFHQTLLGTFENGTDHASLSDELFEQLAREHQRLSEYFFALFDGAKWLTDPSKGSMNKLEVLQEASRQGINTPPTLVTTDKENLRAFYEECQGELISKPLYELFRTFYDGYSYASYTCELDRDDIEGAPERFHPTLLQKRIDKRCEVRSFYLDGRFYSMAILSQSNPRTRSDFRRYDQEMPNRKVPFQLPQELEEMMSELCQSLGLRTGSIDLVQDEEGNFHFLEINHLGQFGMTSKPCNYDLERRIAETLIEDDRSE